MDRREWRKKTYCKWKRRTRGVQHTDQDQEVYLSVSCRVSESSLWHFNGLFCLNIRREFAAIYLQWYKTERNGTSSHLGSFIQWVWISFRATSLLIKNMYSICNPSLRQPIFSIRPQREQRTVAAYSSYHWARGVVHPGQSQQSITKTNKMNNPAHSLLGFI